jgi:hypothetical protein
MKLQTVKVSLGERRGSKRVCVLGEEIVPLAEPGEVLGFKIVMPPDENGYWIVEDRSFGSRMASGWLNLEGVREEVQRRQSELDALRRAVGDAERTYAAFVDERESKKDRHASRRRDGGLQRIKTWLVD